MWIKICPTCNGTGKQGGGVCPTCSGNGIVSSSDPADQYNIGLIDLDGVKHVISLPPEPTAQPWMLETNEWVRFI